MLFGSLLLMPTSMVAGPGDDWGNGGGTPHLSPARQIVNVSVNETSTQLSVVFRRSVSESFIYIYKDGILIGTDWIIGATPGTTYTYPFSGNGTYTVVLQIGDVIMTVFEETIE